MNQLENICPASACFPGYPLETSVGLIYSKKPKEYFIENWDLSHIQLCPQHIGFITDKSANELKLKYPKTNFRLHANTRLFPKLKQFDAGSNIQDEADYILKLKTISNTLKSKSYSYHAPTSEMFNWQEIRNNVLFLQDYLQIPVAIEGLYPMKKTTYWDDSFSVYETFFNSDISFALDLSHLNIAYSKMCKNKQKEFSELAIKMINSPKCLEIHISSNDGTHDEHKTINSEEWWFNVLNKLENTNTVIFCESKQN